MDTDPAGRADEHVGVGKFKCLAGEGGHFEGIGQALLTGILAAEASLAGGGQDRVADRYRRWVLGDLRADHRMSVALQRSLARRIGADGAVRLAGISQWTRRNFARWMFEDYPRALVATPRRWSRGALSTSGAYQDSG